MQRTLQHAKILLDFNEKRLRPPAHSIIYNANSVLNSLIDLRDIKSIIHDTFAVRETQFKLQKMLLDVVNTHSMNDRDNVTVCLKSTTLAPITLLGDVDRINSVLNNLLFLGVKYAKSKSVIEINRNYEESTEMLRVTVRI